MAGEMVVENGVWEQQYYEDCFLKTIEEFTEKIANDDSMDLAELERHLRLAYMTQDDNWIGNGPPRPR